MPEKDDVDYNIDRFIIRRIDNILLGGVKKVPARLISDCYDSLILGLWI